MRVTLLQHETAAYNDFISHFQIIHESGDELQCVCPSCGKKKLYISIGENNGIHKMLLNCFHSCNYKDILNAAGLEPKALYLTQSQSLKRLTKKQCAYTRTHTYTDKDGAPKFRKTIYKYHSYWEYNGKQIFPDDKETFWEHYSEQEKDWIIKGSCNLLYHLDKLTGDTVYIPEGEKDVETLEKMGFIATTAGGGAKEKATEWKKNKYIEQLTGIKNAVILADNDEIGSVYAAAVAAYLTAGGISCKVIEAAAIYSEIKHKGDISDIVGAVGTEKAKELLIKAVDSAEPYLLEDPNPTAETETAPERPKLENPYNVDGRGKLTLANLAAALNIMDIHLKRNLITHEIDYSGAGIKNIDPSGLAAVLPTILYDELQFYLKGCSIEKIGSLLTKMSFDKENEYNPILEKINGIQWDGKDHFSALCDLMTIEAEDKLSRVLLKKWLMQCYCILYNSLDDENCFALETVLVLVGKQGFGKTRLFEKLALSTRYFGEGMSLDPRDKDSCMKATSHWITELGEIGSTMKKDDNILKAFITNTKDENRPPYGKATLTYPRMTSFCGTTNELQYISDETGSRRWATILLDNNKGIDIKSPQFREFNALQLWAQIAFIVNEAIKDGETHATAFRLSQEEQAELTERNMQHQKMLKGEQEVIDILTGSNKYGSGVIESKEWVTVTDFKKYYSELNKYGSVQIGKVLAKLGYSPTHKRIKGIPYPQSLYFLPIPSSKNIGSVNPPESEII